MPPQPEVATGRQTLVNAHTFVAGGLSSLVTSNFRPLVAVVDSASRDCGAILFAASRLLLLYETHTISSGLPFPATGLANENKTWLRQWDAEHGERSHEDPRFGAEAPVIFTQELCEWAMNIFSASTSRSARCSHPAYVKLRELATTSEFLREFGLHNNRHLQHVLQSLAKSLSVVIKNHINVACTQHTAAYLTAKYAEAVLSKREAKQLALAIGKSVQHNNFRTAARGGDGYETLPETRPVAVIKTIRGVEVTVPAMEPDAWASLVASERLLLPVTWHQNDMMYRRYRMLAELRAADTPERSFGGFNLLPLCRSGRVFLKCNKYSIIGLCKRAGLPPPAPADVLSVFDRARLNRVLRYPDSPTTLTKSLDLAAQ